MKKINSIFIFWLLSLSAFAQLNVSAALDSTTILLGDQIQLNFRTTQASSAEYLSADFQGTLDTIDPIELIQVNDPTTTSIGSNDVISQSIIITSFENGTHMIPGFSFSSKTGNNSYQSLSNAVYLNVKAIEIDTTKNAALRPIKDIMEEPVRIGDWIHYILIPLAILFVFILMVLLLKKFAKKKKAAPVEEKKVYIPPHVIAFKKIKELKEKELWQKGEVKAYYSEISYIAREYLENRFNINALEAVTNEIIPELKHKEIPEAQQQQLIQTLRTSDMVKFAKVKPTEHTHASVIHNIEQLVKETQQIAPPPSEDNQTPEEIV